MKIYISDESGFETKYTVRELRRFICSMSRSSIAEAPDGADAFITFKGICSEDRGFSIFHGVTGGRPELTVSGTDGAALLYDLGLYDLGPVYLHNR